QESANNFPAIRQSRREPCPAPRNSNRVDHFRIAGPQLALERRGSGAIGTCRGEGGRERKQQDANKEVGSHGVLRDSGLANSALAAQPKHPCVHATSAGTRRVYFAKCRSAQT